MLRDHLTTLIQSYNKIVREINEDINKMRDMLCSWFEDSVLLKYQLYKNLSLNQ